MKGRAIAAGRERPHCSGHGRQLPGRAGPELHPQLRHYQGADCTPVGSTGERHAATADSIGWQQWSVDLSRFAGQQVELSISSATSFEADLGGWTVSGAPAGSAPNPRDWQRDQLAFDEGAVAVTDDTVFAGFGLEGLAPRERDDFVARALEHLLG